MIFHCCLSAMALLDIVGVWTLEGRREQEPGLHLVHNQKTVTNQVRRKMPLHVPSCVRHVSFNMC